MALQAQQVPLVRASHLKAALEKARRSVPPTERNRLEAIYSRSPLSCLCNPSSLAHDLDPSRKLEV